MSVLEYISPSSAEDLVKRVSNKSKYNNKRVVVDGLKFDSQGECNRFFKLKLMERAGEISNLTLKPKYELRAYPRCQEGGPIKIGKIIPDFEYMKDGVLVTEDFKGVVTKIWALRAKIFAANYGREIVVVKK